MVLVATRDPDLARELLDAIDDEVTFVLSATDTTNLRHQVHQAQPEVFVLDARFGGNAYRALDALPRLVGVRAHCQAIVLLPWYSQKARDEALRLGAFEVVALTDAALCRSVDGAVTLAKRERALLLKRSGPAKKLPQNH